MKIAAWERGRKSEAVERNSHGVAANILMKLFCVCIFLCRRIIIIFLCVCRCSLSLHMHECIFACAAWQTLKEFPFPFFNRTTSLCQPLASMCHRSSLRRTRKQLKTTIQKKRKERNNNKKCHSSYLNEIYSHS